MKATKLILAVTLITALTATSYAGMGANYWTQQGKNAEAQKAKVTASAESAKDAMNCGTCACCGGVK